MDLEYYLLRKKCYETEIYNNKSIINLLEEKIFFSCPFESDINEEYISLKKEIKNLSTKQKNLEEELKQCRENINCLCVHDFETDLIEISPDNCKTITYCKICEYVKK